MDFRDVVSTRRSIRDFRADEVSRESLERIVGAASMAPSGMNMQPWRFHVCQGAMRHRVGETVAQATVHLLEYMEILGPERYEDAVKWYSSLGDAPVIIAVTVKRAEEEFDAMNRMLGIGCAVENLLLAATDEGLGSCCITFGWWVRDELKELLALADDEDVASLVAVGYPSDVPPVAPPRREDVAVWHD